MSWEYLDKTRSGELEEKVLTPPKASKQRAMWASTAGLTLEDVGSTITVDEDNVIVTKWGKTAGEKLEERSFTACWAPDGDAPDGLSSARIVSVGTVDGTVRVEDSGSDAQGGREWQFANPSVRVRRVFLWPSSVLDGATGEDGELSVPCVRFVAHRHSQAALDHFFCGNFPSSLACIEEHVSLVTILIQCLLPFIRIIPLDTPNVCQLKKNASREVDNGTGTALRDEYIGDHQEDDTDAQLKGTMRKVARRAASYSSKAPDPAAATPLAEIGGVSAAEEQEPLSPRDALGPGNGRARPRNATEFFSDALAFYSIPKVKYAMWFLSHAVYTLLLTELGLHFSADRSEWHAPFVWTEVLFFAWSAGRILSEAKEFGTEDDGDFGERLRGYLRDPWNQLDLSFNTAVLFVLCLRVFLLHVDAPSATVGHEAGGVDFGLSSGAEADHVVGMRLTVNFTSSYVISADLQLSISRLMHV